MNVNESLTLLRKTDINTSGHHFPSLENVAAMMTMMMTMTMELLKDMMARLSVNLFSQANSYAIPFVDLIPSLPLPMHNWGMYTNTRGKLDVAVK